MILNGPLKTHWVIVAALLAALWPGRAPAETAASAAASPWADADFAAVRLISAVEAVGTAGKLSLGLHFRLKKGWKVYWRSPGDAGFPPRIDWSGSQNFASGVLSWPVPKRFSVLGFETLGYKNEVVLPIEVTPSTPGKPLSLRATVDYLACDEICVPLQETLSLDLSAGPAAPSEFVHLISRYAVRVPGDGAAHGLAIEDAQVLGGGERTVLRMKVSSITALAAPDMYVEGPAELYFSPPRVKLGGDGLSAVLESSVDGAADIKGGLAGKKLTVTLIDGERFAERSLEAVAAAPGAAPPMAVPGKPASAEHASLVAILAMALLGGLILNLMPCVLPVLSIKLLGVIKHGGGERRTVRLSFIASAAGIVFSFLVLAAILSVLKQAGSAVGWGIQFQHPWFLIAMTLVVILFACNLWGFFEVRLPMWVSDLGEHSSHVHGLGGSFIAGVFATLLATPCSAPFLGTAIGFAFSRGIFEIFAIFTALGLGLALPFLVMAAAPGLATRLPRPGPWMETLKIILGFALAATAGWLLSVLVTQVGMTAAAVIAGLVTAMGAMLFLQRRIGRAGGMAALVLAVLAFAAPQGFAPSAPALSAKGGGALGKLWVPFDKAAITRLITTGKVVFVDVTADWCITCIVNKSVVLSKGEALARLSSDSVVAMQADWTLPSDAISRYLAGFGRYGIPFDAVYGPGAPKGLALPELLTEEAVLSAIDTASKTQK